jgi:hypothetical protein
LLSERSAIAGSDTQDYGGQQGETTNVATENDPKRIKGEDEELVDAVRDSTAAIKSEVLDEANEVTHENGSLHMKSNRQNRQSLR